MMADLPKDMQKLQKRLSKAIAYDIPLSIGKEGVDYFKDSFHTESFDGRQWKEVKRRKPTSKWHGFQYKGKGKKPFSQAATKRKILTGATGELGDSIIYRIKPGVTIFSTDKPYAQVHNEGGLAKVFGKAPFRMPKRQFMGYSREFDKQIDGIVKKRLDKVFK